MKKILLYIFILCIPILCVIGVNEYVRQSIPKNKHKKYTLKTINSDIYTKNQCSWACHNNTNYCKKNHVKLLKNHFNKTDSFYFGIIHSLKSTGNYQLANIIFLIIIIPLILYLLLLKSIQIHYKINNHKRIKNE